MSHYRLIEKVIGYINEHRENQPSLEDLAAHVGLSEFHLQRVFSEWAGVSPKAFLKCLTHAHARSLLLEGASVLETSLSAGLSGPSRLHDLCVSLEAATPGEIKSGGAGWEIEYGFYDSPFGEVILCKNHRGICHLSFLDSLSQRQALEIAQADWVNASYQLNQSVITELGAKIFARDERKGSLKAYVKGSEMQVKVWRALLEIPSGSISTYGEIAEKVEKPKAARAVGTAIGKNSIAYLIPCHRVIQKTGLISNYRWGRTRKQAILGAELSSHA